MSELILNFYRMPSVGTVVLLLFSAFLWYFFTDWYLHTAPEKQRRAGLLLAALLFFWLLTFLHTTVFSRESSEPEVHWEPFYYLRLYFSGGNKELLRTLWMNVLLFVPAGVLLQALWPRRWRRWFCVLLTLLLLTSLSGGAEWAQYRYFLGRAETDDILCNASGAATGIAIHEISRILSVHQRRRSKNLSE